jgi:hypothetical protein
MSTPNRATFIALDSEVPARGVTGIAFAAGGFSDPESAEFGAYLFQPDGDENAYYCDPQIDLSFERQA